jgi:hypothetical protein
VKAVVTGMITTYPVGGVVWDYAQYALGLENLGWEVYYLEDTGWQTYDPQKGEYGDDCSFGVRYLGESLGNLSPTLGTRWHFRSMDGSTYGVAASEFQNLVHQADLFLNVSGGTLLRDEYMECKCKVLIDSDPGWNHFVNYPKWDKNPGWQGAHGYRAHDHFFTYAERIGRPDCRLPELGIHWHPTRPPVVMDCWDAGASSPRWTTVMTWNNFRQPIVHEGVSYGTKELEFGKIETLPSRVGAPLELATGGHGAPRKHWRELGWSVVDSHEVSATPDRYREYIQGSRGEFSVAKNVYVATRSGWFSCRSICYLAASRPVVVQDTGFSEIIPVGEGLFAFTGVEEAADAIQRVESDYRKHSSAARQVAAEYFGSERVLGDLLTEVGLA